MMYGGLYQHTQVVFWHDISYLFIVEIATLTREDGRTVLRTMKDDAVGELIKKHEAEEAKIEAEKKKDKSS